MVVDILTAITVRVMLNKNPRRTSIHKSICKTERKYQENLKSKKDLNQDLKRSTLRENIHRESKISTSQ